MIRKILKFFGFYTQAEMDWEIENTIERISLQRKEYYEKVLNELQINGSLPPNCDLKMPKQSIKIINTETKEVIAEEGKWRRLPLDNEEVTIIYS